MSQINGYHCDGIGGFTNPVYGYMIANAHHYDAKWVLANEHDDTRWRRGGVLPWARVGLWGLSYICSFAHLWISCKTSQCCTCNISRVCKQTSNNAHTKWSCILTFTIPILWLATHLRTLQSTKYAILQKIVQHWCRCYATCFEEWICNVDVPTLTPTMFHSAGKCSFVTKPARNIANRTFICRW